jgi:hypothetical protein
VYQFRDLIEINPKGAKLKEIFNCLGVQLLNFQSSGVKKKMSIAAETLPLLVESLAAETPPVNLQRVRSNRGPRLSPVISFVEDNNPAKAGLVRSNPLGLYKREQKT